MKRAAVPSILVAMMLLSVGVTAQAQQAKKIPMIGYLTAGSLATIEHLTDFGKGCASLDTWRGKRLSIEYRLAEGKLDRLHDLVAELVRLKVDVIVPGGGTSTRAAKDATATIPIVMTQGDDPIGSGFVVSLARPGGTSQG